VAVALTDHDSDSIAFTPLIVSYTVEILPYSLRAKGLTIFNFVVSLALIFNQYVNPIALAKLGWRYYVRSCPLLNLIDDLSINLFVLKQIVYICWLCFELGFLVLFVIETNNRTLEETSRLFDGEEDVKHAADHGEICPYPYDLDKVDKYEDMDSLA